MQQLDIPLSKWKNPRLQKKPQSSLESTAQSPYPQSPENPLDIKGLRLFPTPKRKTPNPVKTLYSVFHLAML